MSTQSKKQGLSNRIARLVILSMLGVVMFNSKLIMEILPNIHIVGLLVAVYTIAFRWWALVPIYIFVFLTGLYMGLPTWWVPYLYVWTVLWAVFMILPKKMPPRVCNFVYPTICALHGFLFGTIYAPGFALISGFNTQQMLVWIVSGLYMDAIHGVSNIFTGLLIVPLSSVLCKITKSIF